jgi:hypothetical protein
MHDGPGRSVDAEPTVTPSRLTRAPAKPLLPSLFKFRTAS